MTTSPARTGLRSGIDTSSLDPAVRPQDDLFRHVNGRWLAEHEIPADRAMDGAFRLLPDQAEENVRGIITELGADRVKAERLHPFGVHERGVERADLGSGLAAVRGSVRTELGDDGPDR